MTAQEAIECIEEVLTANINYDESLDYQLTSDDIDWLNTAKEALKKQTPKRPNTETINRGIDVSGEYDIDSNYICPSCKYVVGDYESEDIWYKHCPECGQALNWSDD